MAGTFKTSKLTPSETSSNKATHPNPSQTVLLTGVQAFKYESEGTNLIQTIIDGKWAKGHMGHERGEEFELGGHMGAEQE